VNDDLDRARRLKVLRWRAAGSECEKRRDDQRMARYEGSTYRRFTGSTCGAGPQAGRDVSHYGLPVIGTRSPNRLHLHASFPRDIRL
jgi:hypothetical protein